MPWKIREAFHCLFVSKCSRFDIILKDIVVMLAPQNMQTAVPSTYQLANGIAQVFVTLRLIACRDRRSHQSQGLAKPLSSFSREVLLEATIELSSASHPVLRASQAQSLVHVPLHGTWKMFACFQQSRVLRHGSGRWPRYCLESRNCGALCAAS